MASPFDLSGPSDPTDNTVASKSTLKRSTSFEVNEDKSFKKLATEDVMGVKPVLPLDGDGSKANADGIKMSSELKVHEYDDEKGGDENAEKSNKSSEKIFHPLVDNNNINVNELETPNELKINEKDDNIDVDVNLESERSKKLSAEDVTDVKTLHPSGRDDSNMKMDNLKTPFEQKVNEGGDETNSAENMEKLSKSSEKLSMEYEMNIKTFNPLIEDNNNMNVNETETTNEPKVYKEDNKIDSDVNTKKLSESSEKLGMTNETNVNIIHPLFEENNNMNVNEPETASNELEVYEDNNIDRGVNSEKLNESSENLSMEDKININKSDKMEDSVDDLIKSNEDNEVQIIEDGDGDYVQIVEDDVQIVEDDVQIVEDDVQIVEDDVQIVEDDVQIIDDDVLIVEDDIVESDEDDEMEDTEDEDMEDYEDDEMEDYEDDEMDDDEEMEDTEDDENPEQVENDRISILSLSSGEESSALDSEGENETPENRVAKEAFRKKRKDHCNKEYKVAQFLINQMRDINEESSEDEIVVISDSNDEDGGDNNQPNLSSIV